jgi:hypothetical protein
MMPPCVKTGEEQVLVTAEVIFEEMQGLKAYNGYNRYQDKMTDGPNPRLTFSRSVFVFQTQ